MSMLSRIVRRTDFGISMAAIALFLLFSFTSDSFATQYNLFNVFRNIALYIFIAIPQAMVIASGGMNLSIGAIGGLAVIVGGYLFDVQGMSPFLVVPIVLAMSVFLGFFNGALIAKLQLNSFIVTLSTMFLFTGFVFGISKGFPYTNIPESFTWLGRKGFFGVPCLLFLAIIALLLLAYVLRYTVFGRHLLATGGNAEAARLSGISTDRVIVLVHMLSGFMAGVAGLLTLSRIGSAQPATGQNWMIISFAVSILGSTALTGGVLIPFGLFMGGVVMVLIRNGLVLLEANVYFEQAFVGSIILLAVILERLSVVLKKNN